ncbi:uncharacterized protein IL334_007625 [Kwoniella shivajii]|uniref:Phytanoyl-CoA dioxygenase n=1 Tax=Kwoniella shivajii TaxID=564305 RepID=A0ABZ1D968_9TREE|nr:hypothetical protein IL334_007625 [Kwoniella shivajii]
MSTTHLQQTRTQSSSNVAGTLRLNPSHTLQNTNWKEDLHQQGWVVIKGVIPREKALSYADEAYQYLESFGLGFDAKDRTTWIPENMPFFFKGGLFHRYGASHEQFVWDIKQEPELVKQFAELWGTEELVCSFDGLNISLPIHGRTPDDDAYVPWPHVDQSPLVTDFHCVQGAMNLLPNGPKDGGLMVLKGSKELYSQAWKAFDKDKPEGGWNERHLHDFTPEQIQWFLDNGAEWHKICADPGDLFLWDSRTVHYGATPESNNPRIATYVCYKPAFLLTPEIKQQRKEAWDKKYITSHDPITFTIEDRAPPASHITRDHWKISTLQEPVLTVLGRKLVGVEDW